MAVGDRWYFAKEQLQMTPSRKFNIDADKELSYRQQAANLIQDMGQRLQVTQLCINTAIVYMHRFYMFHSFTKYHRNAISSCALFLAAKVEEQPRKLEHVIKVAHMCLFRDNPPLDTKGKAYHEQSMELVMHENLMLQTLGFNIGVEHPHRFVVNCCQLVRASKDLAQTSYFMATNSLHLTTMCLQYQPTVVACVCIHLACKWSSWEIPMSSEGKEWFYYVDQTVTPELLEELTSEFLAILDKCPSRLKRKILSHNNSNSNTPIKCDDNKKFGTPIKTDVKGEVSTPVKSASAAASSSSSSLAVPTNSLKRSPPSPLTSNKKQKTEISSKSPVSLSIAAYKEKKDKERAHLQQSQSQQLPQQLSQPTEAHPSFQQTQSLSQSLPHHKTIPSNTPKPSLLHTSQPQQKDRTVPIKPEPQINMVSAPITLQTPAVPPKDTLLGKPIPIKKEKSHLFEERKEKVKNKSHDQLSINDRNLCLKSNSTPTASSSAALSYKQTPNFLSEPSFDSLITKPTQCAIKKDVQSPWDFMSADGDDSSQFNKDIVSDLKMEFSDNDSNQSNGGLNLTSLSSAWNDTPALSPPFTHLPQPISMPIHSESIGNLSINNTNNVTPAVFNAIVNPNVNTNANNSNNSNSNVKLAGISHKDTKDKHSHEHYEKIDKHSHDHHDRHHHSHLSHHHSHKSKHKEKHKNKHKEKHKRRDKDKDKDRSKDKDKPSHGQLRDSDPAFKVSIPKDAHKQEVHTNSNNDPPREAIKLKISKNQIRGDQFGGDDNAKSAKGLKLVISRKGYST